VRTEFIHILSSLLCISLIIPHRKLYYFVNNIFCCQLTFFPTLYVTFFFLFYWTLKNEKKKKEKQPVVFISVLARSWKPAWNWSAHIIKPCVSTYIHLLLPAPHAAAHPAEQLRSNISWARDGNNGLHSSIIFFFLFFSFLFPSLSQTLTIYGQALFSPDWLDVI
jgi:hypothetical protein